MKVTVGGSRRRPSSGSSEEETHHEEKGQEGRQEVPEKRKVKPVQQDSVVQGAPTGSGRLLSSAGKDGPSTESIKSELPLLCPVLRRLPGRVRADKETTADQETRRPSMSQRLVARGVERTAFCLHAAQRRSPPRPRPARPFQRIRQCGWRKVDGRADQGVARFP